ncbi:MAG: DUF389 domain-containing protein [Propionibacteriaceae bacterium]|jgi:uncharacterized hydrophobic protein (TIGR00271 family)
MLHVRLIAPPESTAEILRLLDASPAVTHLCLNEQSARKPSGDVVSFDVAREGATSVLEALRDFGLDRRGAIVVENLDISISESAIKAEEETPGEPADAVVWEGLEQSAGEETRLSITYLCFMMVATMIAGIGVMLDQPILIVGAMVVGPEFGPLVAFCIGIVTRHRDHATRALGTLVLGFAVGMAAAVIFTWIMTALGLLDQSMLIAERPLTSFIWKPDALSWIVGFLAGIAGMLALTSAKSGALVGVLISVTTIPAAANAAVALAYWVPSEAVGSAIQLVINLSAIAVAGTLTLLILKARAERLARRSPVTRTV